MKKFKFNKKIGLIIFVILLLTFPISLTNQVKLNMRILVTGLAIDKVDDEYEITAQIISATGGNESPGTSAEIDFLSEKGETVSKALSNLLYKAGKVTAFSHMSFVIIGNSIANDCVKDCLSVFIRDKVINSSALILMAKENAKDEMKKTKNLELNVGLSLQKVFTYKQEESDGLMVTVLDFMKDSNNFGKTSEVSLLEFEEEKGAESQGGSSQSGGSGGSGGGESSGSSGSLTSASSSVSFKTASNIVCFLDGKYVCELDNKDEILGYMIANPKTKSCHLVIQNILENTKATITIKNKKITKKFRFENEIPILDLEININNSEINEIIPEKNYTNFTKDEYAEIELAIRKNIAEKVSLAFEKAKASGADIFGAYEKAYKFNYNNLKKYYDFDNIEFIKNLKLNVKVNIKKLDY